MMPGPTLSFLVVLLLMIAYQLELHLGHAQSDSYEAHSQLDVLRIRIFEYGDNSISDYHVGEDALTTIREDSSIMINGLVKNQNHTNEHFDFVTEVFDSNGVVMHLDVRYRVAVQLGRELGIDSLHPIILKDPGTYVVKVFTIHHLDANPIILSLGAEKSIRVVD